MPEAIQKDSLIGKRITKLDAPEKAGGKTRYIQDLDVQGQLYGKILRSSRVHAKIKSIDTAAAKALPGVHAVITAADVPWQRPIGVAKDHFPLKTDRVRSLRDEIAAVAAESEAIAEAALKLIKVEYEDLPVLADPNDSLKPGAPLIHPEPHGASAKHDHLKQAQGIAYAGKPDNIAMTFDYQQGDVAAGERESDVVFEDTFHLHYVTHCCMGVSGIIAEFDSSGNLLMYSNTQVPFLHKREFAEILNMDPARIRIIQPPIGGGFGSKLDIYPFEPITVFLAKATGRPVKLVFTREEEFLASPTRQPVILTLRSGCKKDGTLTFRTVNTLHDNGAYTSWGATTPFVMMQTISSLYRVPHCLYHTKAVYTNNPYAGSFRGYGNLQATFAVEQQIDELAEKLGIDPLEMRLKNAQDPGEVTPQGMHFKTCGLKECLTTAAEVSQFREKHRAALDARRSPSRYKRGVGMASMLHVGGGAKIYPSDGCGTILKIDDFAHVTLITGASEIGQGSETVLSQIVCEELGLPISAVSVVNNDTDITPWDVGVHASRTTFIAGNSAITAGGQERSGNFRVALAMDVRQKYRFDLAYVGFYGEYDEDGGVENHRGIDDERVSEGQDEPREEQARAHRIRVARRQGIPGGRAQRVVHGVGNVVVGGIGADDFITKPVRVDELLDWIGRGWVTGEYHSGPWANVGTPDDLAELETALAKRA